MTVDLVEIVYGLVLKILVADCFKCREIRKRKLVISDLAHFSLSLFHLWPSRFIQIADHTY